LILCRNCIKKGFKDLQIGLESHLKPRIAMNQYHKYESS